MIYLSHDSFWRNPSGLGTTADRGQRAVFVPQSRSERELATQFEQDGLFAAAVSMMIDDGLRGGFSVSSDDALEAGATNRIQTLVNEWVESDDIVELLTQHFTQKALFGGSVLLQVTNGDQSVPLSNPLDEASRFLAFAPSEMTATGAYSLDPTDPFYGFPLQWALLAARYDRSWTRPTRTPRLFTLLENNGGRYQWVGPSRAYAFMSQIQSWGLGIQSIVSAMQTLSQRILSTPALRHAQTGTHEAGELLADRLTDINERASNMQAIAIDEKEALTIATATMSGMETALDRIMIAVSTAAQVPVTRLFGVSPGGFGTGETELRIYYDKVRSWQTKDLAPALKWMLERKFPGAARWKVVFPELNVPTQAELLAMRAQQATADVQYISSGVLSADEVAQSRFGGDEYSFDTTLDLEAREAAELTLDEPFEEEPAQNEEEQPDDAPNDVA